MDPWELFSDLCRQVVEEQNVYLEVLVFGNAVQFMLFPLEGGEDEDE